MSVMRDEGSPIVLVTVKAIRDGPEGMVVRSRALPVPLDPDQNGKPRSSIVIVPDDDETVVMPTRRGGRPDTSTPLLVEVLRAAGGEVFPLRVDSMASYPFRPSISSARGSSSADMSMLKRAVSR